MRLIKLIPILLSLSIFSCNKLNSTINKSQDSLQHTKFPITKISKELMDSTISHKDTIQIHKRYFFVGYHFTYKNSNSEGECNGNSTYTTCDNIITEKDVEKDIIKAHCPKNAFSHDFILTGIYEFKDSTEFVYYLIHSNQKILRKP
jgi:hypothetical protein